MKGILSSSNHHPSTAQVPTFIENSALDAWQTSCIFASMPVTGFPNQTSGANGNCSSAPGWRDCSHNPENCTGSQMETMNGYLNDFVSTLVATKTFSTTGNGAFVHSCHQHCEGLAAGWNVFKINGTSMGEAVRSWWLSDGLDPSHSHTFLPCKYHLDTPHACNPTCF